jgi:hypothetical protein
LLYFSGIIVAAELADRDYSDKIARMTELLNLSPLRRVQDVFGNDAEPAISIYEHFLSQFARPQVRQEVSRVRPDDDSRETNAVFRDLKSQGHEFSRALIELLKMRYAPAHPIHEALLM